MLDELEKKGIGCWVGNRYYGALVYADDIVLVSPTVRGLKEMVRTCEHFCDRSDMQFNPDKSVCICFRRKKCVNLPEIKLCGKLMKWEENIKHLGNYLSSHLSEEKEILAKRGDLIGRVNVLLANICGMPDDVLLRLFVS